MKDAPFCFWAGKACSEPHDCNDCAIRDRMTLDEAIKTIKAICKDTDDCVHCPMNHNCNEQPAKWEEVK